MGGGAARDLRRAAPALAPAILTTLTLPAVFRLGFRQTEPLIGFIMLGLGLHVPDHTTLSRHRLVGRDDTRAQAGPGGAAMLPVA